MSTLQFKPESWYTKDNQDENLRLQSVAAWSLHNMGSVIDAAGVFLKDHEAEAFVEMLREYSLHVRFRVACLMLHVRYIQMLFVVLT